MNTPRRPKTLNLFFGRQHVAHIEEANDRLRLHYTDETWREYAGRPLLSCSLPVQNRAQDATDFFDGLLPEGQFRAALAAQASVRANDTYGLLARYGRDVAGAATIVHPGANPEPSTASVEPLDDAGLEREVIALPNRPLGIHEDSELSITGLQNKLLLVRLNDGQWGRPIGGTPSTHILKLDSQMHPGVVTAEADALRLARFANLTTIDVELRAIGGVLCIIVERFDRQLVDERVQRIHQEDACQALGLPADQKYELQGRGGGRGLGGGPEFSQIAGILDKFATNQPEELAQLAKVAAFTAIIGNSDAHGKNLAFLHTSPATVTLAPLYDTVPTALFPKLRDQAAMTIGAAADLAAVNSDAIAREAKLWHFDPDHARSAAHDLASDLLAAIDVGTIDPQSGLAQLVLERAPRFLLDH